tara:strand:+ start:675 stop:833 length:159 start_codon:yes stop_codon:yes gene_type:complete
MNVTAKSNKDDVITAACEIVDTQENVIKDLKDRVKSLGYLLAVTFSLLVLTS